MGSGGHHGQPIVVTAQTTFGLFWKFNLDPPWLGGGPMDDPMVGLHHLICINFYQVATYLSS